jgi:hypothetical protein
MKHPAVKAYEKVWQRIVDNKDDAGLMPQGTGDVVGRARHEAEMKRMGIEFPDNFITQFEWLEEVGVLAAAKRLTRKYNRMKANE